MGQTPSYLAGYAPGLTPDQIGNIQQQGFTYTPTTTMGVPGPTPGPMGGAGFQQPQGYSGLTPDQIQAVQRQGFFNQPGATTGQSGLWDRITKALGQQTGPGGLLSNWQDQLKAGAPQTMGTPTAPPMNAAQTQMARPSPLPQFSQAPFIGGGAVPNQMAQLIALRGY